MLATLASTHQLSRCPLTALASFASRSTLTLGQLVLRESHPRRGGDDLRGNTKESLEGEVVVLGFRLW